VSEVSKTTMKELQAREWPGNEASK